MPRLPSNDGLRRILHSDYSGLGFNTTEDRLQELKDSIDANHVDELGMLDEFELDQEFEGDY